MIVNIPDEFVDLLCTERLKDEIKSFKEDLKKERPMIFVCEPVQDKKLIRQQIKARKLILEYYGA